ncbi:hypothetical protein EB796_023846 [Bugula neritina]|uniref:Uncharacterized protein n=1 Tax=Bugula neritina TaxID=10212 RepID=A0A7J7IVC2_BUGNE|nr:hypothetical protein EB796_023846 [Bugula neritina]
MLLAQPATPSGRAGFTEQLPSVSQTISATHDCDADSNQAIFSNTPSDCFNSTEDFPDDIDIIFGSPMSETSASEPICAISSQLSPSLTNPSHQQKSHSKTFPTTPPIKCNTNSPPTRNKLALPSTGQDPYISYSSLSPTLITSVPP